MDQRQFPRFLFRDSVEYKKTEGELLSNSMAADLSLGGVRIRVGTFIPLRSVVQLKLHLTSPVRLVPVKGQVVWVREVPYSESFDVGIQFLQEEYRDPAIDQFIQTQEKKNILTGRDLKGE